MSATSQVRDVVFVDIFGTIATTGSLSEGYMDLLARVDIPRDQIYPFVRDNLMTAPNLSYLDMVQQIIMHFGVTLPHWLIVQIAQVWEEENKRIAWLPGARELLVALRTAGYVVVIVSNVTAAGLATIKGILDLERYADGFFYSCEQGLVKRAGDPRLWERLRSLYPHIPEANLWMIGDRDDDQPPDGWNFVRVRSDGSDLAGLLRRFQS